MAKHLNVFREKSSRWLTIVSGGVVIGIWIVAYLIIRSKTGQSTLHYTIYFGIDLSGPVNRLWLWPLAGTLSWLTHIGISQMSTEKLWSTIWMLMQLTFSTLLLASLVALYFYLRTS